MNYLDQQTIKSILSLNPNNFIDERIAERQLEVIRRGFNYLNQPGKHALYIADEVGLGKTYVAIGIASLLRHFSQNPETYQDVIVVPKENLQRKWEKEIRQFISNNYLLEDNRVKSILSTPVAQIYVKDKLASIDDDFPAYHFYRNSQFSFGLSYLEGRNNLKSTLISKLTSDQSRGFFGKLPPLYFTVAYKDKLKRVFAYLLSIDNPDIELLIVDEGHNYKSGYIEDGISDRNNVIGRFFGLDKFETTDQEILIDLPELKALVRPKVQKLMILSATPKTKCLSELKNQFDCFLPHHILSDALSPADIEMKLNQFLIRGNMQYQIGGIPYTRNLCRYEHRNGNVVKEINAEGIKIEDNEQALIIGLLQYKTIKHLNAKNNASFELGMLAGFETFNIDQKRIAMKKSGLMANDSDVNREYEEGNSRDQQKSQDLDVISDLMEDYKKTFDNQLPPHPKQDAIVNSVFQLMLRGDKSLIFVRRVASANELERRLLNKWEEYLVNELKAIWLKRMPSNALRTLIVAFEDKEVRMNLDSLLDQLSKKLYDKKRKDLENYWGLEAISVEQIRNGLYYVVDNYLEFAHGKTFYELLKAQVHLKNFKSELIDLSVVLLKESGPAWEMIEVRSNEGTEGDDDYLFHSGKLLKDIKKYRKSRLSNNDWLNINYFLLNGTFEIANVPENVFLDNEEYQNNLTFKEIQETYQKQVDEGSYIDYSNTEILPILLKSKITLITKLLLEVFPEEFKVLLQKLSGKTNKQIFSEIQTLSVILKSLIRHGSGFLPLYLADKASKDESEMFNYFIDLITGRTLPEGTKSVFSLVYEELRTSILDYQLITNMNFPSSDGLTSIQIKLRNQSPVIGLTGISKRNKSNVATLFRMPGFPFVLITTDIFREGEDLHAYCQNIFHYGIAWNCSDMEQRTGRIDRINSLSNRRFRDKNELEFEDKVQVFYPYLRDTLEVNQVSRLFHSINNFTETFNDFTINQLEENRASTGAEISDLPQVINSLLVSRYDHDQFTGYIDNGLRLDIQKTIGDKKEILLDILQEINKKIIESFEFYVKPECDEGLFRIYGDIIIDEREKRRGPFMIQLINNHIPGQFDIEVSSYLFKTTNTRYLQVINNAKLSSRFLFKQIDDYHVMQFQIPIMNYAPIGFIAHIEKLIIAADEFEEAITRMDLRIFD